MDRIDIWVPVQHVDYDTLSHARIGEESEEIAMKVIKARQFARERFAKGGAHHITKNKEMSAKDIDRFVELGVPVLELMKKLANSYALSPRGYHRVLRLARTIADLRGAKDIAEADVLEAFQYRPKLYENRL